MNEADLLKKIEGILVDDQLDCSFVPASPEIPYDRLLVFFGLDYKERVKTLEITLQEQELGQNVTPNKKTMNAGLVRVQFQIKLPFLIDPLSGIEVANLLHFLNRFLELPGYEMSELDEEIYFRYIWITHQDVLTPPLLLSIVGIILMNVDLFSQSIESVSSGEKTYSQLLENMVQFIDSMTPKKKP